MITTKNQTPSRRTIPLTASGLRLAGICLAAGLATAHATEIGQELAVPRHLQDGEEYTVPLPTLISHGRDLFAALWTVEEGGGRPLTKGVGTPLADESEPLLFPRNFNRISAPDSNGCAGCHNAPYGTPGGGGDIVGNVFVLAQRFDCATFDPDDTIPTKGAVDENGDLVTLDTIANSRATLGMFGSGYYEMLARQITADLQAIRDADTLLNAPHFGSLFSSFVTMEIRKLYGHACLPWDGHHWCTPAGSGVDLVLPVGGRLVPIEIHHTASVAPQHFRGLKAFRKLFGELAPTGVLVTMAPRLEAVGDGIIHVPLGLLLGGA